MADRLLVLYTEPLADEAVCWLRERCHVAQCAADDALFEELLARASGLIVRTYLDVDEQLLERAEKLIVVGRAGIGLDNIDVEACRKRNIEVVYTPQASTIAVVEYVFALIFDALRPRQALVEAVDGKQWSVLRKQLVGRKELAQCTVGILGLGRIGSRLARALQGFDCRVLYNDVREIEPDQRHGAQAVDVQTLFAESDILSVHIDGRATNSHYISQELLLLLKDDAVFINTSRGAVVDAFALAAAMKLLPGARALLDVHDPEPVLSEYPLLRMSNVTLLPHLASRTDRGLENMSWVVRDIAAVLAGESPEFRAPI